MAFRSWANNLVPYDYHFWCVHIYVHDRQTGQTTLVSVSSEGDIGNDSSSSPSISGDGRYVAFSSVADNLVEVDTNNLEDVFVHDRVTGQTKRVSVSEKGVQGNAMALNPVISGDGRYIAFDSDADNLVPDDVNGYGDVFVYDRKTGQIELASIAADGRQANSHSFSATISYGGRYVAFTSWATILTPMEPDLIMDVYVHDMFSGENTFLSATYDGSLRDGHSITPSISSDGRYVAFHSSAENLVKDDDNGCGDVFVVDWLEMGLYLPLVMR